MRNEDGFILFLFCNLSHSEHSLELYSIMHDFFFVYKFSFGRKVN